MQLRRLTILALVILGAMIAGCDGKYRQSVNNDRATTVPEDGTSILTHLSPLTKRVIIDRKLGVMVVVTEKEVGVYIKKDTDWPLFGWSKRVDNTTNYSLGRVDRDQKGSVISVIVSPDDNDKSMFMFFPGHLVSEPSRSPPS
jgi:hypothetical protein